MGQRDRSQGFGFMYVDISKLLKDTENTSEVSPVTTPNNIRTVNFNKDKAPAPIHQEVVAAHTDRQAAISQIKQNLDRLQSLHHKLHAMLEELNKITDKTPKSNS